jgi:Fe2+ or Zn2+ uptake regulation protein
MRAPRTKDAIDRASPESPGGRLEADLLSRLAAAPEPLGTYDLLPAVARLQKRAIYPHQVYRALERLIEAALVERVESLSR